LQIEDGATSILNADLFDYGNQVFFATDNEQVAFVTTLIDNDSDYTPMSSVANPTSVRRMTYGTSEYNSDSGRGAPRAFRARRCGGARDSPDATYAQAFGSAATPRGRTLFLRGSSATARSSSA
jgi:hypothetical protein